MSLIHWWPLTGTVNDRGAGTVVLDAEPASGSILPKKYWTYGAPLFGPSPRIANVSALSTSLEVGFNKNTYPFYGTFSFSFWSVIDTAPPSPLEVVYFTIGDGEIKVNSNGYFEYVLTGRWDIVASSHRVPYKEWVHHCLVYDNGKWKYYMNGGLIDEGSNVRLLPVTGTTPMIFGGQWMQGSIQDVRIYDNALSKREVKELSKGLVLHYDFNDPWVESTTNRYAYTGQNPYWSETFYDGATGQYGYNSNSNGQYEYVTAADKYGNQKRMVKVSLRASRTTSPYVHFDYLSGYISKGSYATVSFDMFSTCATSISPYSYYGGYLFSYWDETTKTWIGGTSTQVTIPNLKVNQWNHIVFRVYRETGDNYDSGPGYCPVGTSSSTSDYWLFDNVQIEAKDHATPYVNGTRASEHVYDASGYGNNASQYISPVQVLKDTIVGEYSMYSPAGACAIKVENCKFSQVFNDRQAFTVNAWIKIHSYNPSDTWNTIFRLSAGDGTDKQLHMCYNSSGQMNLSQYADDPLFTFTPTLNQWYMVTWVHYLESGAAKCKFYVNGEQVGNAQSYSGLLNIGSGAILSLFYDYARENYGCDMQMADFKIYATTLLSEDIYNEYHSKATIDNRGNLFVSEIVDDKAISYPTVNTDNFVGAPSISNDIITVSGHWAGFQYANALFTYGCYYHLSFDARYVSGDLLNILGHASNFDVKWYLDGIAGSVSWSGAPDSAVAMEQVMLDGKWHHFDLYVKYSAQNDNYGMWLQVNRTNTSGSATVEFTNLGIAQIFPTNTSDLTSTTRPKLPTKRSTAECSSFIEGSSVAKVSHSNNILCNNIKEI